MMKTRIHTLLPAALLLLATACEDTLNAPGNPATGNGPTLTLALDNREDNGQTRSELTDGAPVNHVESVRILVFKGEGDGATYEGEEIYTDDNATKKAIAWPTPQEGQEKPDQIPYQMNYPFVEDVTYTLLGVGQDNQFATTYGIDLTPGTTTLANAYAKLKEDASPKECDFYTGTTTFTYEGRDTHIDDLRMKRRVAGVLLYVTEIPQQQTEDNGEYRVTSIRVCLGGNANQKSSVRLQRDFEDKDWTEPDGQGELTNSNVVAEITGLEDWTWTAENADFYMKDGKPATARTGVYMLPLNATEGTSTFTVKMYGKKLSSTATDGTTEGEEVKLTKSFTVEQRDADGTSVTSFPIRSNYLYSIGKYNPDAGVDEPISLSGSPIYLEVLPFDELEVSHDFGEAPVQALFDDKENPIYDCINQDIKIKILPPLTTIRNMVTSITLTVDGTTYAMTPDGNFKPITDTEQNLKAEEIDLYNKWCYLKRNDGTYQTSSDNIKDKLTAADATSYEAEVFIADYARRRKDWGWKVEDLGSEYSWQGDAEDIERINNDIRYTNLLLATTFTWNDRTITRYDTLTIKQYNTITVYYNPKTGDDKWTDCGFRRYDLTPSNTNGTAWGFHESLDYSVDHDADEYNGLSNMKDIGQDFITNWYNSWNLSASGTSYGVFRKVSSDAQLTIIPRPTEKKEERGYCWYLPARYELDGIMVLTANNNNGKINTNIRSDWFYWSSTLPGHASEKKAWAIKYDKTNNTRVPTKEQRTQTGIIRQARRFPDDNNYNYQW